MPIYNSLVAFEVPHWHEVTAVSSERYRYSIFGWWHQQGERYELLAAVPSAGTAGKPAKKGKKHKAIEAAEAAEGSVGDGAVKEVAPKGGKKLKKKAMNK